MRSNGNASGLQVSYSKALRAVAVALWLEQTAPSFDEPLLDKADRALRCALSERQRARLEARGGNHLRRGALTPVVSLEAGGPR